MVAARRSIPGSTPYPSLPDGNGAHNWGAATDEDHVVVLDKNDPMYDEDEGNTEQEPQQQPTERPEAQEVPVKS